MKNIREDLLEKFAHIAGFNFDFEHHLNNVLVDNIWNKIYDNIIINIRDNIIINIRDTISNNTAINMPQKIN